MKSKIKSSTELYQLGQAINKRQQLEGEIRNKTKTTQLTQLTQMTPIYKCHLHTYQKRKIAKNSLTLK